jgi:predicted RND superfamily exporter protein
VQTIYIEKSKNLNINIFDNLIKFIKEFIQKYKLLNIENKLDNIINEFKPLEDKVFVIIDENDINKYDNFLEYLEQLQEYLENIEDLKLTTLINMKLDNALDIVTLIQFRISGAISDYRLKDICK